MSTTLTPYLAIRVDTSDPSVWVVCFDCPGHEPQCYWLDVSTALCDLVGLQAVTTTLVQRYWLLAPASHRCGTQLVAWQLTYHALKAAG